MKDLATSSNVECASLGLEALATLACDLRTEVSARTSITNELRAIFRSLDVSAASRTASMLLERARASDGAEETRVWLLALVKGTDRVAGPAMHAAVDALNEFTQGSGGAFQDLGVTYLSLVANLDETEAGSARTKVLQAFERMAAGEDANRRQRALTELGVMARQFMNPSLAEEASQLLKRLALRSEPALADAVLEVLQVFERMAAGEDAKRRQRALTELGVMARQFMNPSLAEEASKLLKNLALRSEPALVDAVLDQLELDSRNGVRSAIDALTELAMDDRLEISAMAVQALTRIADDATAKGRDAVASALTRVAAKSETLAALVDIAGKAFAGMAAAIAVELSDAGTLPDSTLDALLKMTQVLPGNRSRSEAEALVLLADAAFLADAIFFGSQACLDALERLTFCGNEDLARRAVAQLENVVLEVPGFDVDRAAMQVLRTAAKDDALGSIAEAALGRIAIATPELQGAAMQELVGSRRGRP